MSRQKAVKIVELKPKTEYGKTKMSYHGSKWIFKRAADTLHFIRGGPFIGVISKDGKAFIWLNEKLDPDFEVRKLY